MPALRRVLPAAGALSLTGALLVGGGVVGAPGASAAPAVRVLSGSTPDAAVVPNDRFTVADTGQLTGRRVALPVPACTAADESVCDATRLLNTLDGFDLQPRVFIPFSGGIDVRTVTPATVYVEGGGRRVGLQQLTFDPASSLLAATTRDQLAEQTRYTLVVTRSVRDSSGRPLAAEARVPFTTMSGTTQLDQLRRALDDGSAYRQAGIASRAADFTQTDLETGSEVTTVFPPTATETIMRGDQTSADPDDPLTTAPVPNLALAGAGCYAFGSIESPQYARADSSLVPTPSGRRPTALGKARIGFAMIVPAGPPPEGGWPVAVYGPGFTRSYFDLFVTSDLNAAAGIATVATDPLGHGFGPASTITVPPVVGGTGEPATFLSYGRGKDLDGDGTIGEAEGSQPTNRKTLDSAGKVVSEEPSPNALQGLRGGLVQTTVDNMALVRAVENGITVPSCGLGNIALPAGRTASATRAAEPLASAPLSKTGVKYYGLSFGGIYGTMLMGTDPHVKQGLLNVGGGPIVDIARLSGFRSLLADTLRASHPRLTNGGPGLNGFTESMPDPYDAPITKPVAGAMTLQRFLAYSTWYGRPGGPEPYAPLLRTDPRNGLKNVAYQVAFGDNTVPNITSGDIIRAGNLFDRLTYYRNDKTPTSGTNPHGFLADPTLPVGRQLGEAQLTAFLSTGDIVNPDATNTVFEFPIKNRDNLQCLHYPNPQTGRTAFPEPAAGECPARPADPKVVAFDASTGTGSGATAGGGSGGTGGTSGTSGSRLPSTGAPGLLPFGGTLLLGGLAAAVLRRRATDDASVRGR